MKKFKFSMSSLLNARQAQKDACELELVKAQNKLKEEEETLKELKDIFQKQLKPEKVTGDLSGAYFLQREKYLKFLKDKKNHQQQIVAAQEDLVEQHLEQLILAKVELEKMEKSQEREFQSWSKEYQKHEQKVNDEIGNILTCFKDKNLNCLK